MDFAVDYTLKLTGESNFPGHTTTIDAFTWRLLPFFGSHSPLHCFALDQICHWLRFKTLKTLYLFSHSFLVSFSLLLDLATKSPLRFSTKWRSLSVGYFSPAALTSISGRGNHSKGHLHGHRPVRRSSPLTSPSRLANYEQPKVNAQEHRSSGLRMDNSGATANEQGDQPGEEENQSNRDLCQRLDGELVTFCGNDTESCFLTAAKCNGISDCVNGFDESVEMCGKLPGCIYSW